MEGVGVCAVGPFFDVGWPGPSACGCPEQAGGEGEYGVVGEAYGQETEDESAAIPPPEVVVEEGKQDYCCPDQFGMLWGVAHGRTGRRRLFRRFWGNAKKNNTYT
ncbi:MAG: hypothetical protein RI897_3283 [Verrucomicrobiota bacterium]|jgi:hypothetical protein